MNHVAFVHSLSDLLRDYYRSGDYAAIILPLVVIRRLNDFDFKAASLLPPVEAARQLTAYLTTCPNRDILNLMDFESHLGRLVSHGNLLPLLLEKFAQITLSDHEARLLYEEIIRHFLKAENGEHLTPPDVVELMVGLLLEGQGGGDDPYSLYDPTCGIGGMLFAAADYAPDRFCLYGQERNPSSGAIAKAGLRLRGEDPDRIKIGDTLTTDSFPDHRFDRVIANPPFGVSWRGIMQSVKDDPRFQAGLPPVNDSTMLFLQHCLHKIKDDGRVAILTNGSPLFSGHAGSGPSNIRRWIIENDWLEAIIGLPERLFYNTGIQTYVWVLTKQKHPALRGKIQLVNAAKLVEPLRRNEGEKHRRIKVGEVLALYQRWEAGPACRILPNQSFGYTHVTTSEPERGRDSERIPLDVEIQDYLDREVLPYAPKTVAIGTPVTGYEINFNRHFYTYTPPRSLEEIRADLQQVTAEIRVLTRQLFGDFSTTAGSPIALAHPYWGEVAVFQQKIGYIRY